jgi:hypothetical protein
LASPFFGTSAVGDPFSRSVVINETVLWRSRAWSAAHGALGKTLVADAVDCAKTTFG